MYVPGSVPKGPHYLYIFQHRSKPWFKIGESRSPHSRRTSLGRYLRSKEYRKWSFENYYGCFYVEQAIIGMMKTFEFPKVHSGDWFELDQPTMDAIIIGIDELVELIIAWEGMNVATECDAIRLDKPYGAYLSQIHYLTLQLWTEPEDALGTLGALRHSRITDRPQT